MPVFRKKIFTITSSLLSLVCSLLLSANKTDTQTVTHVSTYYNTQLDSLQLYTLALEREVATAPPERITHLFEQARIHYKKTEAIIEYHFPASATRLNGAPIPESEPSEPKEPTHPKGFQVLEAFIYGEINSETRKIISYEVSNINTSINKLKAMPGAPYLNESNILDAIRLNIYRMIIKGITGFDNPVGLQSIKEAEATLVSTRDILYFFPNTDAVKLSCNKAISFIQKNGYDFNSFDRAVFISEYVNPLCIALYDFQEKERIPFSQLSSALSVKAKHIFEQNAFDIMHFAPAGTEPITKEQVVLGKKLFFDPAFSANGNRSCASCHKPEKAFTDGLQVNESLLGGQKLSRNTPTLINAALQPVQFYDGRITFLEDQAHDVISNEAEMGGKMQQISKRLNQDKEYRKLFLQAYSDKSISSNNIKKALAAYVRSLTLMNSPFDRYMQGDKTAMTPQQIKGLNLFMGKAKCATCHFVPLFSGAVSPLYQKSESEVLGVPANADTLHPLMDMDSGKYLLYGIPQHLYSFKTVTLRNVAATAPYMHNGVYNTLEEVVDFYDRGGGAGLGFNLLNQTLSPDRLHLTDQEKKELMLFLHALTDKVIPVK
jgi:cytochrome c peroxidase